MDSVRLGRQLENLRAQAGLSREALADKLSIGPATIARIEDGERPPSMEVLIAWAQACGQHVSVQFSAQAAAQDAKVGEILTAWHALGNDDDRQRVLRFARAVREANKAWKDLADGQIRAVINPRTVSATPEPAMPDRWTPPPVRRSATIPPADDSEAVLERLRARTAERAAERDPDEEETVQARGLWGSLMSKLGGDKR